ncbi:choice-of-anchor P family protein [Microbispora sp. H10836]|uniref:choice-of-anchor P family protein n=1 Tax=Microbispora sp. H10836 TaxID=2729106 RepID=UPI0014759B3D|nr:choice-of-anchor P family protein [Microbispora sp. H10836]
MRRSHARGHAPGPSHRAFAALGALVLSAAALTAQPGPAAADPGDPGVPASPKTVFAEDFEHGQGATPILVSDYTGAAPVNQTYTADPAWLTHCNGWIASQQNPAVAPANSGCGDVWATVKQMAGALGQWADGDPAANHAVTAYTEGADPGSGRTQLESNFSIDIGPKRFLAFSVDVAETNCFANHAKLGFYLLDAVTAVPAFTTPIEPCAHPGTTIGSVAVGTYTSDGPILFGGGALRLRLVNFQASGIGNDAAFDNVRILDVTPRLDVSYSPDSARVGETAALKFTITNTSELAVKKGWSFKGSLPSGLTVAGAPSTDCVDATVTAPQGGGQVTVTGTLPAGAASCTATVTVSAAHTGTYRTCAADVTDRTGIDPPGCAEVTFTRPVLVFDAHAHGGRVSAPLVTVAPLVPSDVTCTDAPGSDDGTLLQATLPGLGSLGAITTKAAGTVGDDGLRTASASAKTAGVNLLGGLVTADEITAKAKARDGETGQVDVDGSVYITNLKVGGVSIIDPKPNLTINIPLVAKVVINEQVTTADGAGVVVNAIHVRTLAGVDIVVSHARAALTVPGKPCPSA